MKRLHVVAAAPAATLASDSNEQSQSQHDHSPLCPCCTPCLRLTAAADVLSFLFITALSYLMYHTWLSHRGVRLEHFDYSSLRVLDQQLALYVCSFIAASCTVLALLLSVHVQSSATKQFQQQRQAPSAAITLVSCVINTAILLLRLLLLHTLYTAACTTLLFCLCPIRWPLTLQSYTTTALFAAAFTFPLLCGLTVRVLLRSASARMMRAVGVWQSVSQLVHVYHDAVHMYTAALTLFVELR